MFSSAFASRRLFVVICLADPFPVDCVQYGNEYVIKSYLSEPIRKPSRLRQIRSHESSLWLSTVKTYYTKRNTIVHYQLSE